MTSNRGTRTPPRMSNPLYLGSSTSSLPLCRSLLAVLTYIELHLKAMLGWALLSENLTEMKLVIAVGVPMGANVPFKL